MPVVAAAGALSRGELVPVLPKTLRLEGRIALVYPDRDLVPPQVRAFIDWMAARLPAMFLEAASLEGDKRTEPVNAAGARARRPRDIKKRRRPSGA